MKIEELLDMKYQLQKAMKEKERGNNWDLLDVMNYTEAENKLWKIKRAINTYIRTGELPEEI